MNKEKRKAEPFGKLEVHPEEDEATGAAELAHHEEDAKKHLEQHDNDVDLD